MKFIVTGSSGGFGRWVIRELQRHGHSVVGFDQKPSGFATCETVMVNLMDFSDVFSAISEKKPDAIINLAAFPRPGIASDRKTFLSNFEIWYNILEASAALGIKKVIHASTDGSYGFVFAKHPFLPSYLPVDEEHPQLPQDSYGGSKLLNEQTAQIFARANPDMQITCLRICWLIDPDTRAVFLDWNGSIDALSIANKGTLFSYVDMRDAAVSFRLAAEKDMPGFSSFLVCADDTYTDVPTRELMNSFYSGVAARKEMTGFEALFTTEKAKRVLGWRPQYSWRDTIK